MPRLCGPQGRCGQKRKISLSLDSILGGSYRVATQPTLSRPTWPYLTEIWAFQLIQRYTKVGTFTFFPLMTRWNFTFDICYHQHMISCCVLFYKMRIHVSCWQTINCTQKWNLTYKTSKLPNTQKTLHDTLTVDFTSLGAHCSSSTFKQNRQCTYERNSEARLGNNCCSGRTLRVTYSECVTDLAKHAKRMRHIICSLSGSIIFFHISWNGTIFGKTSETFLITTRIKHSSCEVLEI
jgi:hypothetical protein